MEAIRVAKKQMQDAKVHFLTGVDLEDDDWTFDLKKLKNQFEGKFCIQGNLDPTFLLSSNNILKEEINKIKNIMTDYPGFIFNLGHGISKDTDPSKVSYMVDIIRDIS